LFFKDPLDCTKDPCHLAWIVPDNRELKSLNGETAIMTLLCENLRSERKVIEQIILDADERSTMNNF
jgi:hypothetical protein